jgi:hypothetical protein
VCGFEPRDYHAANTRRSHVPRGQPGYAHFPHFPHFLITLTPIFCKDPYYDTVLVSPTRSREVHAQYSFGLLVAPPFCEVAYALAVLTYYAKRAMRFTLHLSSDVDHSAGLWMFTFLIKDEVEQFLDAHPSSHAIQER